MSRFLGEYSFLFNEKNEQVECVDCSLFAIEQDLFDAPLCEEHYFDAGMAEQADRQVKAAKEDAL